MTHERNWVQETIDIRLIIDGIIRDSQEASRDIGRLAKIAEGHATRINELGEQVQALRSLAFLASGFALGVVLLAFGWWWVTNG